MVKDPLFHPCCTANQNKEAYQKSKLNPCQNINYNNGSCEKPQWRKKNRKYVTVLSVWFSIPIAFFLLLVIQIGLLWDCQSFGCLPGQGESTWPFQHNNMDTRSLLKSSAKWIMHYWCSQRSIFMWRRCA